MYFCKSVIKEIFWGVEVLTAASSAFKWRADSAKKHEAAQQEAAKNKIKATESGRNANGKRTRVVTSMSNVGEKRNN